MIIIQYNTLSLTEILFFSF